jgi:hypothetical protein
MSITYVGLAAFWLVLLIFKNRRTPDEQREQEEYTRTVYRTHLQRFIDRNKEIEERNVERT